MWQGLIPSITRGIELFSILILKLPFKLSSDVSHAKLVEDGSKTWKCKRFSQEISKLFLSCSEKSRNLFGH